MVKKYIQRRKELIEQLPYIQETLGNGNDISSALVGTCYIDACLTNILERHLNEHKLKKTECLNDLHSKNKAAYKFRLIDESIYNTIDATRKIRNLFAHSFSKISFDSEIIKNQVSKFEYLKNGNISFDLDEHGNKAKFGFITKMIGCFLLYKDEEVKNTFDSI